MLYRRIIECVADPVYVIDPASGYRLVYVNEAACGHYGLTHESLLEMAIPDWDPNFPDLQELDAKFRQLRQEGSIRIESVHQLADGRRVPVEISVNYLKEEDKEYMVGCFHDISDRKKAEASLRESEQRFRDIANSTGEFIWELDAEGRFVYVTEPAVARFGLSASELLGRKPFDFLFPEDVPWILDYFNNEVKKNPSFQGLEHRIRSGTGETTWVQVSGARIVDEQGRITGFRGTTSNITKRKLAEAKLALERKHLRDILDGLFIFVAVMKPDGTIIEVNRASLEATGIPREDLLGTNLAEAQAWAHRSKTQEQLRSAIRQAGQGVFVRYDVAIQRENDCITLDFFLGPLRDDQGQIVELLACGVDITDRKRAELALQHARDVQRRLMAHQQSMIEEERRRIARELHDELAQDLSILKLHLSVLKTDTAMSNSRRTETIEDMQTIVGRALSAVGRIAADLRPPALDELGLVVTLDTLISEFSDRTGISGEFSVQPADLNVDHRLATALYRIVQESLTNVMRHAQATQLKVTLQGEPSGQVMLKVQDNGIGMSEDDRRKQKSFGLIGIRERVEILGGTMEIHSGPGLGTTISITLPSGQ